METRELTEYQRECIQAENELNALGAAIAQHMPDRIDHECPNCGSEWRCTDICGAIEHRCPDCELEEVSE